MSTQATKEHPFYVEGKGWMEAAALGIGTSIVTRAGPAAKITKVERKAGEVTVYNFTVGEVHTYFVGHTGSGIWVHNPCPPHRAFPGVDRPRQNAHDPTNQATWRPLDPRSGNPTTPFDPTQLPPGVSVEDALKHVWENPRGGDPNRGQIFGETPYPLNAAGDRWLEVRCSKRGVHGWPLPGPLY